MKGQLVGSQRKTGVDILRMLSMYMVVVLHVLGQGGVLSSAQWMSKRYMAAWWLEIAAFCAVNCFGLISGYVGYGSKFRWSKLVGLWLQVAFYTVGITVLFAFFAPDTVSEIQWIRAFFPFTTSQYWYITAYAGMFLFLPFLNLILEHSSKVQVIGFLLAAGVMFSVLPRVLMEEPYELSNGYSMIWLIILYLLGGWIRKYNIVRYVSKRWCVILFLGSTTLVLLSKLLFENKKIHILGKDVAGGMFVHYLSPFIILNAVALLCLFAQVDFQSQIGKNLVRWLSPAALGVYLVHVQPLVWSYGMKGIAATFSQRRTDLMALSVLGLALAIYVGCTVVELLRLRLFSWLRVQKLLKGMDEKLSRLGG